MEFGGQVVEVLYDLAVEGDAVGAAVLLVFVLGEAGVEDAVVFGGGLSLAEGLQDAVHVVFELVEVGEGLNVEGHEDVLAANLTR